MVKVCGITNFEDGELAVNLGADMLGVVRATESPRNAPRDLISRLMQLGVPVAGVYTDMNQIPEEPEEDFVQMHFDHSLEDIEGIKERGVGTISVIKFTSFSGFLEKYETMRSAGSNLILLESKDGIMKLKDSLLHLSMMYDFGISGGINSNDIPELQKIKPKFVDLSSSLELFPGKKDAGKLREFFSKLEGHT